MTRPRTWCILIAAIGMRHSWARGWFGSAASGFQDFFLKSPPPLATRWIFRSWDLRKNRQKQQRPTHHSTDTKRKKRNKSGCSAAGSAGGLGPSGRRFDPCHSDQNFDRKQSLISTFGHFLCLFRYFTATFEMLFLWGRDRMRLGEIPFTTAHALRYAPSPSLL